jgi:hypothetical protein
MCKYPLKTQLFNDLGLITCLHPIASALQLHGRSLVRFPSLFSVKVDN